MTTWLLTIRDSVSKLKAVMHRVCWAKNRTQNNINHTRITKTLHRKKIGRVTPESFLSE